MKTSKHRSADYRGHFDKVDNLREGNRWDSNFHLDRWRGRAVLKHQHGPFVGLGGRQRRAFYEAAGRVSLCGQKAGVAGEGCDFRAVPCIA